MGFTGGKWQNMLGKTKDEVKLETVIGETTIFQGSIKTKSGIRIDGKFEGGTIEAHTLIVGEKGSVNGDIIVQKSIIGGKVTGNIIAAKRLEIQSHAQVYGDVQTSSLVIAEGAIYEGHCIMTSEEKIHPESVEMRKF